MYHSLSHIFKRSSERTVRSRFYRLHKLPSSSYKILLEELFQLSKALFSNMDKKTFAHIFKDERIMASYLACCYNQRDEMVGFFSLQVFPMTIGGQFNYIFRGQTGILPDYRRKTASIFFLIFIILYFRFRHPFKRIRCILAVLNPVMYKKLACLFSYLHPSHDCTLTEEDERLLISCAGFFDFELKNERSPFLVRLGVNAKVSEKEKTYWAHCNESNLQYFLQNNPLYEKGYALLTHIPFHWKNILYSSIRIISFLLKRTFKQVLFRLKIIS